MLSRSFSAKKSISSMTVRLSSDGGGESRRLEQLRLTGNWIVEGGDLLLSVASMAVSLHLKLLWLLMLSSGNELSTIGWWRKKPIGSKSMESPPPLAINLREK